MQRQLTYTEPPAPGVLEWLDELEMLEAAESTAPRVAELRTLLAGEMVHDTRFTLAPLSVLGKARYQANVRSALAWAEEQYPTPEGETPEGEALHVRNGAIAWALVCACVTKVEGRDRPVLEPAAGAWEPAPRTLEAWRASVADYLESVPATLHDALMGLAGDLNPQLWVTRTDDTAKKRGGVSVS